MMVWFFLVMYLDGESVDVDRFSTLAQCEAAMEMFPGEYLAQDSFVTVPVTYACERRGPES